MVHAKFDMTKIARLDDEARFEYMDPAIIWAAAATPSPRVIVDVGAGTGLFARRFAALAPDATVFAADTEPGMIAWMVEHADPALGARLKSVLSQESHVPLPDDIADVVVMMNLHHELADPAASYKDAHRLVRPGGKILVVDWAPGDTAGGPPQDIRSTPEQIIVLLQAAGFGEAAVHPGLPKHSIVTARKLVP